MEEMEEMEILAEIETFKSMLADSDFKAIKHSEGLINDEEYAEIKEKRQYYRAEINRLRRLI